MNLPYENLFCNQQSNLYLSLSALFLIDLSWLMALLFSIEIFAWLARISLLSLKKEKKREILAFKF